MHIIHTAKRNACKILLEDHSVTDSLTHGTFSCFGHISIFCAVFVVQYERSLRFCPQEFDKEAISDGFILVFREGGGV